MRVARRNHGAAAKALFARAHLAYPPGALLVRAFKGEDLIFISRVVFLLAESRREP